jgi:hypothetical protein
MLAMKTNAHPLHQSERERNKETQRERVKMREIKKEG